jgi:hypothetical protein
MKLKCDSSNPEQEAARKFIQISSFSRPAEPCLTISLIVIFGFCVVRLKEESALRPIDDARCRRCGLADMGLSILVAARRFGYLLWSRPLHGACCSLLFRCRGLSLLHSTRLLPNIGVTEPILSYC